MNGTFSNYENLEKIPWYVCTLATQISDDDMINFKKSKPQIIGTQMNKKKIMYINMVYYILSLLKQLLKSI